MSLWKVSDEATSELMVSFYHHLMSGETRSDALRQAKLEMIRREEYQHPFFWAPFIASGSWERMGSNDRAPRAQSLNGAWTGSLLDSVAGPGTVHVSLFESGRSVSGSWSVTFGDSRHNNSGTAVGSIDGSTLSLILKPVVSAACGFDVTATYDTPAIAGQYTGIECPVAVTGSVELTRR